ncbi:MAG: hypothetical protein WC501_01380 [Candidatus Micrarchaeia archaeon]
MIEFNSLYLIVLIFILNFIPGALFSFSLLKGKNLLFVEKMFIGFASGLFILPIIPFILVLLNIPYSFIIAIASVILFYILSIALAIKFKPWEEYSFKIELSSKNKNLIISIILILVVFLSYWIRIQSFSPIYFDLDPYFYLYSATQILTSGIPSFDDKTAWYPEVIVDHRNAPALSFLESIWYSFYTAGGGYDNYLLSSIASFYPPIMACLAFFFVYLIISSTYQREFGLIAASLASLIPMLIIKLAGSEFEVQAYAFFGIAFFYAMYAFAIKNKDITYSFFASIGMGAVILGSNSVILPIVALLIFVPLYSIFIFFKENSQDLYLFSKQNILVFILGFYIPTFLFSFYKGSISLFPSGFLLVLLISIIFSLILYYIKKNYYDLIFANRKKLYLYSVAAIIILGIIFMFSPIGEIVSSLAKSSLGIAQYNQPLDRTIQEQAGAGSDLSNSLGFIGYDLYTYFSILLSGSASTENAIVSFIGGIVAAIFYIPTAVTNLLFEFFVGIGNSVFNLGLEFSPKVNSLSMSIILFGIIFLIYSFYRELKFPDQRTLAILFLAMIFPPIFIGFLKSKYTLYAGFFLAVALGVILGEANNIIPKLLSKINQSSKTEEYAKKTFTALIILGALIVLFQFKSDNLAEGILFSSMQVRFQDDPVALQPKFQNLCDQIQAKGQYDEDVCLAAKDPVGYASKGINYQYNYKLCIYSLISNPFSDSISQNERIAVGFRCLRLNEYWIDSMEWIQENPDEKLRITSWWDYGHWTNYFGEKNTVLRNEHSSHYMIGEVAHNYLQGTPEELKEFMIAHDSEYALFDSELLMNGGALGGKYGALNYLQCARNNETSVQNGYMGSACEWEHLWETIYVPFSGANYQECVISPTSEKTGIVSYKQKYRFDSYGNLQSYVEPMYCFGKTTLIDGSEINALYYLNEKYENGDLKLNKGFLYTAGQDDEIVTYNVLYSKDFVWVENGQIVSGWQDRKGPYYDSNLYNAYFLKQLDGFDLVYENSNIRIFKIKE